MISPMVADSALPVADGAGRAAPGMRPVYLVPCSLLGGPQDWQQVDQGVDPAEAMGWGRGVSFGCTAVL